MASIKLPFEAYQGDGDYIFASYAHADSAEVYEELNRLNREGFNVWYDDGITPRTRWSEELASAIEGSSVFFAFVSPGFVVSENCINKIEFALSCGTPIVVVHLEETELPPGLRLNLGSKQAIIKAKYRPQNYERKLSDLLSRMLDPDFRAKGDGESPAGSTRVKKPQLGWTI